MKMKIKIIKTIMNTTTTSKTITEDVIVKWELLPSAAIPEQSCVMKINTQHIYTHTHTYTHKYENTEKLKRTHLYRIWDIMEQ